MPAGRAAATQPSTPCSRIPLEDGPGEHGGDSQTHKERDDVEGIDDPGRYEDKEEVLPERRGNHKQNEETEQEPGSPGGAAKTKPSTPDQPV